MTKVHTLTGGALDWAVAKAESLNMILNPFNSPETTVDAGYWAQSPKGGWWRIGGGYSPSTNWDLGGRIIDENTISVIFDPGSACRSAMWFATRDSDGPQTSYEGEVFDSPSFMLSEDCGVYGPTALVAAMRCYVQFAFGDEIDIPKELLP